MGTLKTIAVERSVRWLVVIAAAAVTGACGGGPPEPPPPAPVVSSRRAQPVTPANRLYRDDRSQMGQERVVITDIDGLRQWWSRATAAAGEPPPVPRVDFQSSMVILVSAGRRNAGDQIQVDSVGFEIQPSDTGGTRTVSFAVVRTIEDCNPFPGVAYPLEIVRMPRADPAIDWIEIASECE